MNAKKWLIGAAQNKLATFVTKGLKSTFSWLFFLIILFVCKSYHFQYYQGTMLDGIMIGWNGGCCMLKRNHTPPSTMILGFLGGALIGSTHTLFENIHNCQTASCSLHRAHFYLRPVHHNDLVND
jgi:hypothetical protein